MLSVMEIYERKASKRWIRPGFWRLRKLIDENNNVPVLLPPLPVKPKYYGVHFYDMQPLNTSANSDTNNKATMKNEYMYTHTDATDKNK